MPLPEINLDDRNFDQLFEEAKRRIPGFAPEWTDHNDSDPGIALVQLFAWLSETLLWRINQVPEKNYLKLLELLGIELTPPAPARADLAFSLTTPWPQPDGFVTVPAGTRVALGDAGEGGPVIFETDETLHAIGLKLAFIQSFDGARFHVIDDASRGPGRFFLAFGDAPREDAALYLGFEDKIPAGQPKTLPAAHPIVLTLHVSTDDLIEEGRALLANRFPAKSGDEEALGTASQELPATQPPPVIAVWEYWADPDWRALDVTGDTTASLTRSGSVTFNAPPSIPPRKLGLLRKPDDQAALWLRYRVVAVTGDGYEVPPRLENVFTNTVGATNVQTVTDELLGASSGLPNQRFQLAHRPVLPEPFQLLVDENDGEGFRKWERVRDFAASKRDDRHFTLNTATGEIAFGDGKFGKIPHRYVRKEELGADVANIRAALYRWGGGARGNAGPDKITGLQSSVPYVEKVTNPRASAGGDDEEKIEAAKLRAPGFIRTRSRAVTAGDLEFLARQTPGARIRRAKALPLHNPHLQPYRPPGANLPVTAVPAPGAITVLVIPDALAGKTKPLPSEETLGLVGVWLNKHRLATAELYVAPPKYRLVSIDATVKVARNASIAQVEKALMKMLLSYFHPLMGGAQGEGWEFGQTILFSETFRRILNIPGVAEITSGTMKTRVDDRSYDSCEDVPIAVDEVVYSTHHTLDVSYV